LILTPKSGIIYSIWNFLYIKKGVINGK